MRHRRTPRGSGRQWRKIAASRTDRAQTVVTAATLPLELGIGINTAMQQE
jgi:hypothetical protein